MKILFDTSVLIASMLEDHVAYDVSYPYLKLVQQRNIVGYLSNHSLAELYAILTRLPRQPRISPNVAQLLLNQNLRLFNKVILTIEDYELTIKKMVNLSFTGGAIYDALISQCAIKSNVDVLLTLNPNHFTRLGNDIAKIVKNPLENNDFLFSLL
jgi:predicted nucleic acid-binding protein